MLPGSRPSAVIRAAASFLVLTFVFSLTTTQPPKAVAVGNTALQLTTNSYVTFGDPAKLDLATFTIETWFKKTGTGTPNTTGGGGITILPLLTHGAPQSEGSDVDANWILGIDTGHGNVIAADFEGKDDPADPLTGQNNPIWGTTPISDNEWHHAAATFDGTTFAVYLDGNLEASNTPGFHPRDDSRQGVGLGTMITTDDFGNMPSYVGRFDGVIDEARVWNRALDQTEIQDNRDLELTSGTGLVARWGLNEGSSTNVGDSITTPSAADGTVSGSGYAWVSGFPIAGANNAPVAVDDAYSTPQDTTLNVSATGVLGNDTDADADPLTAVLDTDVSHGSLTLNSDGSFDYTPTGGYNGPDSFTYHANDGTDDSNVATVTVAVGNTALQLTTNSYVTFGDPAKLDLATFTIETWFKKTGTGTPNTTGGGGITILPLLTHGAPQSEGSDVDANWILGIDTGHGNVIAADFEGKDDPADPLTGQNNPIWGTTPIGDNEWHHAAATFDGTTFAVYLDGNLEASNTPGFHPRDDSRQGVGLGTMITTDDFGNMPSYVGRFDGVIDEARVWNRALDQTEIQDNRDLELTSGTGLVARWGLNEGSSTNVGDSITTPSAADGTVSGSGYAWVSGFVPPVAGNAAPDAPTLNAPSNGATSTGTSPTLNVGVSDPDGDPLTVTYYGRPYASGNFAQIAQHTSVSAASDTATGPASAQGRPSSGT